MLITLTGIDGAGKSTQIALLVEHFERTARRVATIWYRPGYSPELDALRALVRRLRPTALPRPGASAAREAAFRRTWLRATWVGTAICDLVLQYAAKLRLAALRHDVVICDRYLEDALLDLGLRFPELGPTIEKIGVLLRTICSRPDHALLLWLPEEEMLRRLNEKAEPFPDDEAIRRRRYQAYQALARGTDLVRIEADRSVQAVHRSILRAIGERGAA